MSAEQKVPETTYEKRIVGFLFELLIRMELFPSITSRSEFRVVSKSPDGAVLGVYSVRAALDDEGVRRIRPLLGHGDFAQDNSVLRELYSITQSCSCSDWGLESEIEHRRQEALNFGGFQPILPTFEDLIEDPSAPSRFFTRVDTSKESTVRTEAELAPWGEFLTLTLTTDSVEMSPAQEYFKVLLPEKPGRTFQEAYKDLARLLTRIGSILDTAGPAGLTSAFARTKLDVFRREHKTTEAETIVLLKEYASADGARRSECKIASTQASIAVTSNEPGPFSKLSVAFSPGDDFREFTAAQIRRIRGLAQELSQNSRQQQKRAADLLVMMLDRSNSSGNDHASSEKNAGARDENASPGALSLRSLVVVRGASTVASHNVINAATVHQVSQRYQCAVEAQFVATNEALRDYFEGACTLSIRLKPSLAEQHPELLSWMVIVHQADKSGLVRVANSMGGVDVFSLLTEPSHEGVSIYDELSLAFGRQGVDGIAPLLALLHERGKQASNESAKRGGWRLETQNLPNPSDAASIANLVRVGDLLRLTKRGDMSGIWGVCQDFGKGSAMLGLGRSGFPGALELRLSDGNLRNVTIRCRSAAEDSQWRVTASCSHGGLKVNEASVEKIVRALREFFRDQDRASRAGDLEPETLARENLKVALTALSCEWDAASPNSR